MFEISYTAVVLHFLIYDMFFIILLFRSFYVDDVISKMIGVEMSIAIDIALALGSTESIVESLYSVMKAQSMDGGQSNSTLALR